MAGFHSDDVPGNRYDASMVSIDVRTEPPSLLLVARLHVDLCRLASAMCRYRAAVPA
jgi:hypothetical protein